jgi:hypothetical protein
MDRRQNPDPKREEQDRGRDMERNFPPRDHRPGEQPERQSGRHEPMEPGKRPEDTPRKFGERREKPQSGRREGGSSR